MTRLCRIVVGIVGTALGALALSACSSGCVSLFAPNAELIDSPVVEELRQKPESATRVDHSTFAALLEAYIDYEGARVDYAGLKTQESELDVYLDKLEAVDLETLGDDEALALLINAYNAFTLKLVLEHYPELDSIKDIELPWKTKRWEIGGHKLSLDDIEHGLIRPLYKDSRIHFAVNCASKGCPPLAPFAYEGHKIDEQLERATKRTLGDRRYARVENGKLLLTSVMNWYRPDFVSEEFSPTAKTLPAYAARYGSDEVRQLVKDKGGEPAVSFMEYDWSLNDVE